MYGIYKRYWTERASRATYGHDSFTIRWTVTVRCTGSGGREESRARRSGDGRHDHGLASGGSGDGEDRRWVGRARAGQEHDGRASYAGLVYAGFAYGVRARMTARAQAGRAGADRTRSRWGQDDRSRGQARASRDSTEDTVMGGDRSDDDAGA